MAAYNVHHTKEHKLMDLVDQMFVKDLLQLITETDSACNVNKVTNQQAVSRAVQKWQLSLILIILLEVLILNVMEKEKSHQPTEANA